ncbi:MAG: AmmeMemoRadiSam system protein A [Atribacterota bacterium]
MMIRKSEESIQVQLARKSIVHFLERKQKMGPPANLPEELTINRAGVFVSLKKDGHLRGCIGTFLPTQDNIALEIIENAVSAATRDPRFPPVTIDEVEKIDISVDILSPPEEVKDISQLDPQKYGVIVSSGFKKGLLLPNLEGVDTAKDQVDIARRKAGIYPEEKVQLSRFEVKRYH